LICCSNFSFGQNNSDSFSRTKFSRQFDNAKYVNEQLRYAESIFDDSLAIALSIIESNLIIAVEKGYSLEEGLAYQILGDFNLNLENYNVALSNYKKSITIYDKLGFKSTLYELNLNTGLIYFKTKNYELAESSLKKSLSLAKRMNETVFEVAVILKLGNLKLIQNETSDSKLLYQSGLKKSKQKSLKSGEIESLIGLGKCFEYEFDNTNAGKYYEEALKHAQDYELDHLANKASNLLTELYLSQNEGQQGLEVQQQAYGYNSYRGNGSSVLENMTNMSIEYTKQGKTTDALNVLNDNVEVYEQEENTDAKRNFIKVLAETYEEQGFPEKAKQEEKKYNVLLDSFLNSKQEFENVQSAKSEYLLGTENKLLLMEKDRELNEKMIEVLKRESEIDNDTIQRQATTTYILIGGLVIIGILAFLLFRSSREKQASNQLLILKSLRNQMNPHFIFNSLNSVNSFIAKKDERSANKYLAEFSKLMREVLECSQENFIALSKEIEILKLYLNLEHYRFNSHFDFTLNIDPKINLDEHQIPPMLLQPFIENSIWHGLRYKKEKGELNVSFKQCKDYVEIVISDNGIGRDKSKNSKTLNQRKMKSTGIKNVENRLEIIKNVFKKDLDITISDFDIITKEGTVVTLKLY
jgi:hypothetical protein